MFIFIAPFLPQALDVGFSMLGTGYSISLNKIPYAGWTGKMTTKARAQNKTVC
jgi:hypothetical protein